MPIHRRGGTKEAAGCMYLIGYLCSEFPLNLDGSDRVHPETGHEAKMGGSDAAIPEVAIPRGHDAEGAEESEAGARIATT